ncbi:transposase family protein [Streptomyces sp. NBC_00233]|nr:transposase family protein [Streptomyces sp. NBC_00233]MCX5233014.1 transposase family protein [Streptomyces sp. NBC_00233]
MAGRCRGTPSPGTWWGQEASGRRRRAAPVGLRRPAGRHADHLRHDLPHSVLALLFGVGRSTVTRAIGEIRVLLAERGCGPRPSWPAAADPGRCVRLCPGRGHGAAAGRHRNPGPPCPWPTAADAARSSRGRRS